MSHNEAVTDKGAAALVDTLEKSGLVHLGVMGWKLSDDIIEKMWAVAEKKHGFMIRLKNLE
jgi:hypothetical protein